MEMRLIDADALKKKWQDVLDEKADEKDSVAYVTFELFIERLAYEPTIDAVPVVRCKDCKWYKHGKHFTDINFCQRLPYYAEKGGLNTADDDFCSYGERRSDA